MHAALALFLLLSVAPAALSMWIRGGGEAKCCTTPEDGLRNRAPVRDLRETLGAKFVQWETCETTGGLPLRVHEGPCEKFLELKDKYLYFGAELKRFKENVFYALSAALSGKTKEGRIIKQDDMEELVYKAAKEARAYYVLRRVWETVRATKIDVPSITHTIQRDCSERMEPDGRYFRGYTRNGQKRRLSYAEGGEGWMVVVTVEPAVGEPATFQVPGVGVGPDQEDEVEAEAQKVAESAAGAFCAAVSKGFDKERLVQLQERVKNLDPEKEEEPMMKEGVKAGREAAMRELVAFQEYFFAKYPEEPELPEGHGEEEGEGEEEEGEEGLDMFGDLGDLEE